MLSGLVITLIWLTIYGVFIGSIFTKSAWTLLGFLIYFVGLMVLVPYAIGLYTTFAIKSGQGQTISLAQASNVAWGKIWPMLGLYIVIYLGTATAMVLFVVPGLIFLARTLLAPLYMLDENIGPMAAIDRSFKATKGHTIEMMGSIFAGMLMGGGYLLAPAVGMAPLLGRYQEIRQLEQSGSQKPKTHWLNYMAVFGGLLLIFTVVGLYIWFIFYAINQASKQVHNAAAKQHYQVTPSPSPGVGTSQVDEAENVAAQWLQEVQKGNISTAYGLEDPSYQRNFSQAQQLKDTAPIRNPVVTNTFVSSVIGQRSDGSEILVAVYRSTMTTGQVYYIQIEVQKNGPVWKVWGQSTSYEAISPKIPA